MKPPESLHTPLPAALTDTLSTLFGKRFSQGESIRLQHGRDESVHAPELPDGVVFAESPQEVAETVRLCHEHKVPIIAYGAACVSFGAAVLYHHRLRRRQLR